VRLAADAQVRLDMTLESLFRESAASRTVGARRMRVS
jgi:hypothetical protein